MEISYEGESALAQCLPVWGQVSAVMQKGADLVVSEKTNPTPPLRGKAVEGISEAVEPVRFSAELDAIQRESRERLATKADDADVPIYLWEDHLINDNDGWLVPEDLLMFQIAGLLLKEVMLCWWKRHVFQSFFDWLVTKHSRLRSHHKEAGSGVTWTGKR